MRAFACFLLAAAMAGCQSLPAPPEPSYRLVDLTGEFSAVAARTQDAGAAAQLAAFETEIAPLFPEFYGQQRFPQMSQARYQARIVGAFAAFPAQRSAFERTAGAFASMLEPAETSFRQAYPDMGEIGEVYLLHSLGEMDGGMRRFGDKVYFIFGADVIARLHAPGSERPFFHHELFHLYHSASFGGCAALWCSLWTEGLAVAAAHELNPHASDAQLLLTQPEPIRPAVDAHLGEAVCAVRARLQSADEADFAPLFMFERLNERLPPRFAYYVGYLAAREARRTHSMRELARMDAETALATLQAGLSALTDCAGN